MFAPSPARLRGVSSPAKSEPEIELTPKIAEFEKAVKGGGSLALPTGFEEMASIILAGVKDTIVSQNAIIKKQIGRENKALQTRLDKLLEDMQTETRKEISAIGTRSKRTEKACVDNKADIDSLRKLVEDLSSKVEKSTIQNDGLKAKLQDEIKKIDWKELKGGPGMSVDEFKKINSQAKKDMNKANEMALARNAVIFAWGDKYDTAAKKLEILKKFIDTIKAGRRPRNYFVPVKKGGENALIVVVEFNTVPDRQNFIDVFLKDDDMRPMSARTQQTPRVERINRSLISAVQTAAKCSSRDECKLSLRGRTVTMKGKVVVRFDEETEELVWFDQALKKRNEEEKSV